MQVRRLEPVGIDDAEAPDAGPGEILKHGNAKASRADHQHGGGAQPRLAFGADFAQRDLARVVRCRNWHVLRVLVLVRVRRRRGAFMTVRRWRGATLAVHPAGITIDVVLFLPDGHAMFDFIDDEAAGAKRLVAMRGADAHPDGHFAQRQ